MNIEMLTLLLHLYFPLFCFAVQNQNQLESQLPQSSFSCDKRISGYYADVSTGCQIYHMCDGLGRQFSYKCPNKTLFQQRMLICDHWYMVNCSKAEEDYSANLLIGQQNKAFVEDNGPFHRTPRPDLAQSDSDSSSSHRVNAKNVVGVESSTNDEEYLVPSHWSTEISAVHFPTTTPTFNKRKSDAGASLSLVKQSYYRTNYRTSKNHFDKDNVGLANRANFPSKFQATTPVYPNVAPTDPNRISEFDIKPFEEDGVTDPPVNFISNFKATTPVYPSKVNIEPEKLSEFDLPLGSSDSVNFASNFKATTPVYPKVVEGVDLSKFSEPEELPLEESGVIANFASNFKATTPVYPKEVNLDLSKFQDSIELPKSESVETQTVVNFQSRFKATTPVYPQSVESTSPVPEEFGLLPPLEGNTEVNFKSNFLATTPDYPKFVEPTSPEPNSVGLVAPHARQSKLLHLSNFDKTFKRRIDEEDPSVTGNNFNSKQFTEFMLTIKPDQLKNLKQLWHIPDYDFPLDSVSRPSYETDLSSFQAVPKSISS
ncbi:hypothetical protein ABEB36_014203 [Hypothenemus hampei]|uniref:Chitin-binding type-2 domain-containing protein n=1 Tax=Hypothenemus hampei TaxID=57062 RepID=A0ABD1E3M8_HYPHA